VNCWRIYCSNIFCRDFVDIGSGIEILAYAARVLLSLGGKVDILKIEATLVLMQVHMCCSILFPNLFMLLFEICPLTLSVT
jgi:hypothetical protein